MCGCTLAATTAANTHLVNTHEDYPEGAQLGRHFAKLLTGSRAAKTKLDARNRRATKAMAAAATAKASAAKASRYAKKLDASNRRTKVMAAASKAAADKAAADKAAADKKLVVLADALKEATDALAADNEAAADKTQMPSASGCQANLEKAEIRLKKYEATLGDMEKMVYWEPVPGEPCTDRCSEPELEPEPEPEPKSIRLTLKSLMDSS